MQFHNRCIINQFINRGFYLPGLYRQSVKGRGGGAEREGNDEGPRLLPGISLEFLWHPHGIHQCE